MPEELLHYLRTRGKNRIIFATDSPVLSMARCLGEVDHLDLDDDARDRYLYQNAQEFFFS